MSQTVIGPGTRIAGAGALLMGQDDLVVEGTVEGPIHGEAAVTIKAGARVGGAVYGRDVTIAGELQHPVFATGVVRLLATAKLTGDIEAPRISIDEGAVFEGQVRMRKPQPAAAPAPAKAVAPAPPAAVKTQPIGQASANTPSPPAPPSLPAPPSPPAPPLPAPVAAQPPRPQPAAPPPPVIVQSHNNMVQAHNNQLRAIPELAAPGRKRLIRKTP